ncbi:MAG: hypothetical protein AM1032_000334 [Mycoplasmataceae bacterium]|nr:MAG: hypothetical protein AM1032_000334 [Mycoplasmataceae bacterium]
MSNKKLIKNASHLKIKINESKKFIFRELLTKEFFIKFFFIYIFKKLIEIIETIVKSKFTKCE